MANFHERKSYTLREHEGKIRYWIGFIRFSISGKSFFTNTGSFFDPSSPILSLKEKNHEKKNNFNLSIICF